MATRVEHNDQSASYRDSTLTFNKFWKENIFFEKFIVYLISKYKIQNTMGGLKNYTLKVLQEYESLKSEVENMFMPKSEMITDILSIHAICTI